MKKTLLTGNEALARGAWEAGALIGAGYPGAPITEAMECFSAYPETYAEWSTNEKAAFEVGTGASFIGARVFLTMKGLGLNVAMDTFMATAGADLNGGMLVVTSDDAGRASSDMQDSRALGYVADIPMFDPSDSQECKDFVKLAYEISGKYGILTHMRVTAAVLTARTQVVFEERKEKIIDDKWKDHFYGHKSHSAFISVLNYGKNTDFGKRLYRLCADIDGRMDKIKEEVNSLDINKIEINNTKLGIVTSGVCYHYVKEILPDVSVLKLGVINPLPEKLIKKFAGKVDKLICIEETYPFIENRIKAMGIDCSGSYIFERRLPFVKFTPDIIREKLAGYKAGDSLLKGENLPTRLPTICPGCPLMGVMYLLKKLKTTVFGYIGCASITEFPPMEQVCSVSSMGASAAILHGAEKTLSLLGKDHSQVTCILGDGGFNHTGISGLMNTAVNNGISTTVILDNVSTAMTGGQGNPSAGFDIDRKPLKNIVKMEDVIRSFGIKNVHVVDSYDLEQIEQTLNEELPRKEASVVIVRGKCYITHRIPDKKGTKVIPDKCTKCGICFKLYCYAIEKDVEGRAIINGNLCHGCGLCAQVCKFDAIVEEN